MATTLEADLYVGTGSRAASERLPESLPTALAELADVAGVSVSTDRDLTLADGPLWLKAVNTTGQRYRELNVLDGSATPWQALAQGAVLVSEPLLTRLGVGVGGTLRLPSDVGEMSVTVAGVFRDYGSDRGLVLMDQKLYQAHFDDSGFTGIGLHARAGANLSELEQQVRARIAGNDSAQVRSTAWIREASMAIFDQTFLITRVMQWLATLIAAVGVVSALMALALERRREFAILRAQGVSQRELFRSLQIHNALLGLAAGLLAMPLGVLMARVLVDVVNRRAFGWSMTFQLAPEILLSTLCIALVAALLAGLYPGWSMVRNDPARSLALS